MTVVCTALRACVFFAVFPFHAFAFAGYVGLSGNGCGVTICVCFALTIFDS